MASGRRGGPPDLKGTLGILLRTTLDQMGAVKDAVEKQARSQRGRLDQALEDRRRQSRLAELGEAVYHLAQRGELGELALEPSIGRLLSELAELDELDAGENFDHGVEAVSSKEYRTPALQRPQKEYRVWRPVLPEDDAEEPAPEPTRRAGRGANLHRPRRVAARSAGGIHFVDEGPRPGDLESDEDLTEYMHKDDVPTDE